MASYIHKIVIVKYILITKKEIIKRKRTREAVQRYRHSKSAVYYTANIFFYSLSFIYLFPVFEIYEKEIIGFSLSTCMTLVPFQLLLCTTNVTSFSFFIILPSVR